jgi:hypothetical protein
VINATALDTTDLAAVAAWHVLRRFSVSRSIFSWSKGTHDEVLSSLETDVLQIHFPYVYIYGQQ